MNYVFLQNPVMGFWLGGIGLNLIIMLLETIIVSFKLSKMNEEDSLFALNFLKERLRVIRSEPSVFRRFCLSFDFLIPFINVQSHIAFITSLNKFKNEFGIIFAIMKKDQFTLFNRINYIGDKK